MTLSAPASPSSTPDGNHCPEPSSAPSSAQTHSTNDVIVNVHDAQFLPGPKRGEFLHCATSVERHFDTLSATGNCSPVTPSPSPPQTYLRNEQCQSIGETPGAGTSEKDPPPTLPDENTCTDSDHHQHSRTIEPQRASPWLRYSQTHDDGVEIRHKSCYVWRVLGYLTCLNPILSIFTALYTSAAILIIVVSFPLKNIASSSRHTFSQTIISHLSPQLVLHLRFLYLEPHPILSSEEFCATRLVLVHLLSPLIAIPISVAAGCLAFVWLYTEILLGDKNEESGMEYRSFLFVRQRWENFIFASLRPETLGNGGSFRSP